MHLILQPGPPPGDLIHVLVVAKQVAVVAVDHPGHKDNRSNVFQVIFGRQLLYRKSDPDDPNVGGFAWSKKGAWSNMCYVMLESKLGKYGANAIGQIVGHECGHLLDLLPGKPAHVDKTKKYPAWLPGEKSYCIMDYANSNMTLLKDEFVEFSTIALKRLRKHPDPDQ